eukprot:scaffold241699_cov33-Prasinocladus_malaysianus.AAC.1
MKQNSTDMCDVQWHNQAVAKAAKGPSKRQNEAQSPGGKGAKQQRVAAAKPLARQATKHKPGRRKAANATTTAEG